MTKSNIYTILCTSIRLGAVFLAMQGIGKFVELSTPHAVQLNDSWLGWGAIVAPFAMKICIALALWFSPGLLARLAANKRSLEYFASDISPDTLQYIAISILGLWFATSGLVDLAYSLSRWVFESFYVAGHLLSINSKEAGMLLSEFVQITLGIALSLRSRGVIGLFRRFREAGLNTPSLES